MALDEVRLRRFEQEARTASALNHPNILSVFDVGAWNGIQYLVTELVEGATLRDRLAGGALPPRAVVHVGAQIADGLTAAHGAGRGGGLKSVSAVGGTPRLDVADAVAAHISPDGRLVAIWKATGSESRPETALWIGPLGGTLARYEPAPVVVEGTLRPNVIRFSPDGTRILLWVTGGPPALLIVPVPRDGTTGRPAQRAFEGRMDLATGAAWMPDSRRVVLPIGDSLWPGEIASGRLTRLTAGPRPGPDVYRGARRTGASVHLRCGPAAETRARHGS